MNDMTFDASKVVLAGYGRSDDKQETREFLKGIFIRPSKKGAILVGTNGKVAVYVKDETASGVSEPGIMFFDAALYREAKKLHKGRRCFHKTRRVAITNGFAKVLCDDEELYAQKDEVFKKDFKYPDVFNVVPINEPVHIQDFVVESKVLAKLLPISRGIRFYQADDLKKPIPGYKSPVIAVFDNPEVFAIVLQYQANHQLPAIYRETVKICVDIKKAANPKKKAA